VTSDKNCSSCCHSRTPELLCWLLLVLLLLVLVLLLLPVL
jgi:hypothetical protein